MTSTTTIRISRTTNPLDRRPVGGFVGALTGATEPVGGSTDEVEITIDAQADPSQSNIESASMAAASAFGAAFDPIIPAEIADEYVGEEQPVSQGGTEDDVHAAAFKHEAVIAIPGDAYLVKFDDGSSSTYIYTGEELLHPAHGGVAETRYPWGSDQIVEIRLIGRHGEIDDNSASFSEDF